METSTTPKLLNRQRFEARYGLKWKTALGWERDGIVRLVRLGRLCFADRDEFDHLIAAGGRRFAGGWRRRPEEV
jgi:hypothetical protein